MLESPVAQFEFKFKQKIAAITNNIAITIKNTQKNQPFLVLSTTFIKYFFVCPQEIIV